MLEIQVEADLSPDSVAEEQIPGLPVVLAFHCLCLSALASHDLYSCVLSAAVAMPISTDPHRPELDPSSAPLQ